MNNDIVLNIMMLAGKDKLSHEHPMVVAAHELLEARSFLKSNVQGMPASKFFEIRENAIREYEQYANAK